MFIALLSFAGPKGQCYRTAVALRCACLYFGQGAFIDIGLERRMEAVDHVAKTNGQTDVNNLLFAEMLLERTVSRIVNRLKAR